MPDFEALHQQIQSKNYLLSKHASTRSLERDITAADIEVCILSGELIEDYPNDKYGPSCLILGQNQQGRILHIHVSYPPKVKIITLYEPSEEKWELDWKTRKTPS
jgi:hypothetical protein